MSIDILQCMDVFLVAYTCFNLNLVILPKLAQTNRQNPLYSDVKTMFALKLVTVVQRLLVELAKI
jgi:hypothetical protein